MDADVSHFSIKGPGKVENQDAIIGGLKVADGVLFAVADGLGGLPAGEVASKAALVALGLGIGIAGKPDFDAGFQQACRALGEKEKAVPANEGMATTISAAFLKDGKAHIGHVGDSRIYRLRYGKLSRMTKDQTRAQQMIDAGEMTENESHHDVRQHVLLSCITARADFTLMTKSFGVETGDRFLLVTDGIYNVIDDAGLAEMTESAGTVASLSEALFRAVDLIGPRDDATAICLEIP